MTRQKKKILILNRADSDRYKIYHLVKRYDKKNWRNFNDAEKHILWEVENYKLQPFLSTKNIVLRIKKK